MKRKYWVILILYWVISTTISAGAIHANNMAEFRNVRDEVHYCRKDLGFAWGWSMLPIAPPIGFMLTGFWQDGFRWDCNGAS